MSLRLIVDIGGTNARFSFVETSDPAAIPQRVVRCPVADFPDFEAAATAYLTQQDVAASAVTECVLAAAGPLQNGVITLTNAHWVVSQSAISDWLGGARTRLLNDLEAIGYLLPLLGADEIETILTGKPPEGATLIAVNVGTGFNSSLSIPTAEGWTVLTAEAGHAMLPQTQNGEGPRGTIESLLSGPGIAALRARKTEGIAQILTTTLGLSVRNLILSTGSWGGVYLCGGVMQNAPELLDRAGFAKALRDEGPMAGRLTSVPVHRITTEDPTLKALARLSL